MDSSLFHFLHKANLYKWKDKQTWKDFVFSSVGVKAYMEFCGYF